MYKVFQNRTTGLQKKEIQDSVHESDCITCRGKGVQTTQLPATLIRNVKASSAITVESDCKACDGTGKVKNKIRIIRKNQVTTII